MNRKGKACYMFGSTEMFIRINSGSLKKLKYQGCTPNFYIRISKDVGQGTECFTLCPEDFFVYIDSCVLCGYLCFLKSKQLSLFLPPSWVATTWQGVRREGTLGFGIKSIFLSLWLCGSQPTVENSKRDRNTRPPDLPPGKSLCRSRSNS